MRTAAPAAGGEAAVRLFVVITVSLVGGLSGCVGSAKLPTRHVTASGSPRFGAAPATRAAAVPVAVPRPTGGAVLRRVDIPASDGFDPRPAYVYLPPAYALHPDRRLPVLELLHGTPGQPADRLTRGLLLATADAFAATHRGAAPIVVLPDINGAQHADSQCIRTRTGENTEQYLTTDVVSWVRARYPRAVGAARWWIAGLSEGGVCSLMLALRHPSLYSAFGDFSGTARPIVDHRTEAASNLQLYGTDVVAKRDHDPLWLLSQRRHSALRGWFACGAADRTVLAAQSSVAAGGHGRPRLRARVAGRGRSRLDGLERGASRHAPGAVASPMTAHHRSPVPSPDSRV